MQHNLPRGLLQQFDPLNHSITISDARQPDMPLIYVNQGFEQFSGYAREEVIGRNCRFLQGDRRDQDAVRAIRAAIAQQMDCIVDLVNFKKDGTLMHNRISLRPILDAQLNLLYYVGIQSNITVQKERENKIIGYIMKTVTSAA